MGCFRRDPVEETIVNISDITPAKLSQPDTNFRLTAEQRAVIRSGYDAGALERLLARIHPKYRDRVRALFGAGGGLVTSTGDAELDELLGDVLSPRWAALSDEQLREADDIMPGRERELRRRGTLRGESDSGGER
jgi:hypothetical protein